MSKQKGVSPLVATVMLIVIVVSLVALISGWLTNLFTGTRETVTNRTDTSVGCSGASISVESVYVNPAGAANATVRVTVRNDGLVDQLSLNSAQYYNTTGHNFSALTALPINGFNRGDLRTIYFENVSMTNCTAFSQVVIGTQCTSAKYVSKPTNC